MIKANQTYKALFLFTLLFIVLAVASFAAFGEAGCTPETASNCIEVLPAHKSDIFWDIFTNRFLSFIGLIWFFSPACNFFSAAPL